MHMERIAAKAARHLIPAVGLLVLCVIALGIATDSGSRTVPGPERATLGDVLAPGPELERAENVVPEGRAPDDDLWRPQLDVVLKELERGHIDVAVRAWQDAYGAALASRSWESMIAVGDAFMAVGRTSGSTQSVRTNAREAYLAALIRARRDRSVDGMIRSAEAFQALDDRPVGEQCLHIAAQLAAGNARAEQKVREARQRWTAWQTVTAF